MRIRVWTRTERVELTCTAVQMVEITIAVLVVAAAYLAVEAWLTGSPTADTGNDHGLVEILIKFKIFFSLLHVFCGLWEIFRRWTLPRLQACAHHEPVR